MTDHRTESQKDRGARGMVLFNGQEITREAYDRIRGITASVKPAPRIGIPYAPVRVEGFAYVRTCPVCGEDCRDEVDNYGETTTDTYAAHYAAAH